MSRVIRTFNASLAPEANCDDCDWEWPISRRTLEEAKAHIRETDHKVIVTSRVIAHYQQTKK